MLKYCYKIIILYSFTSFIFGIMYDGIHTKDEYLSIAKSHPYRSSVCKVILNNSERTGILISNNIVLTAAHGLKVGDSVSVIFENHKTTAKVVKIDDQFLERINGENAKYDKAIIKLEQVILNAKIPKILKSIKLPQRIMLTVLTYGNYDRNNLFLSLGIDDNNKELRGFHLFEIDDYYASSLDRDTLEDYRSQLLSSIFFNRNNDNDREIEAVSNWHYFGKKPYGLALPGTSGAPVFIDVNGEEYLFGIVTSYGSSGDYIITKDISFNDAIGKTHTIFIPIYKKNVEGLYKIDPFVEKYFED